MCDSKEHQHESRGDCAAAARRVVEILQDENFVAYFAGGCVRDWLMGLKPKDYDVATDAVPDEVRRIFKRTIAVGEHFGVILVQLMGCRIEVATFRKEGAYGDFRRPDSVHFTDARQDANRRDFTINGLFYDPVADEIIDFVGGEDDIQEGIIRAIGNADDRLAEDHLRALRAVRFAARFGFRIEEQTKEAVRKHAGELAGVSRERIGQELRLMLKVRSAHRAGVLLHKLALDAPVFNEPPQPGNALSVLDGINPTGIEPALFATVLAAIAVDRGVDDDPDFVRRWRKALLLTNDERDAIRRILTNLRAMQDTDYFARDTAYRKRLYGTQLFYQSMRLLNAIDNKLATQVRDDITKLQETPSGISPQALINGDDLNEMGLTPGPAFRIILDRVYDAQLREEVTVREEALRLAQKLADKEVR